MTTTFMRIASTRALILCLFTSCYAFGATTPDELVAEVEAAIKARDGVAFQKCFNLAGTEPGAEKAMQRTIDKVFSWPSHYVFTSERVDKGPMHVVRDGVANTLNGEWMINLNMYQSKPPSKGLVFPAGFANGKCLILAAVKEDKK
jgi:hypothetical protein